MTHYFSRLARTTGLGFGPGAHAAAARRATTRAPLAPPHADEVTFAEPPPTPHAFDAGPRADTGGPQRPFETGLPRGLSSGDDAPTREEDAAGGRDRTPDGASAAPAQTATRVLTPHAPPFGQTGVEFVSHESAPRGQASRVVTPRAVTQASPRAQSPPGAENLNSARPAPDFSSRVETTEYAHARRDALARTLETLGVIEGEAGQGPPRRPDEQPPDAHAQADVRRAYLREVVEWIAATPDDAREDAFGSASPEDAGAGVGRARERSGQSPLERARGVASGELEVQDFSLSIGTISVVVEGPQRPAPEPARARGAAAEGGRASSAAVETSRLRRHYIRGL